MSQLRISGLADPLTPLPRAVACAPRPMKRTGFAPPTRAPWAASRRGSLFAMVDRPTDLPGRKGRRGWLLSVVAAPAKAATLSALGFTTPRLPLPASVSRKSATAFPA